MAKYGDFNISENEPELYLLFNNDILASLDLPDLSDMEGLPKPGVPAPSPPRDSNQWQRNSLKRLRIPGNPIPQKKY